MLIIGALVLFYIVAILIGRRTSTVRPGTYLFVVLLALAQALIVLFDLTNTPIPKP